MIVKGWVAQIRLDPENCAPTLCDSKAGLVNPWTKKLVGAVLLPLGHASLEGTVRALGTEVDDALKTAERTEV